MRLKNLIRSIFSMIFCLIFVGALVFAIGMTIYASAGGSVGLGKTSEVFKGLEVTNPEDRAVTVLLLGVDKDGTRADFIALASLQESSGQAVLVSIPRDTKIVTNYHDKKINAAFNKNNKNGIIDEVRKLTGIRATYYMTVDIAGFRQLVNGIGGVKVNVPMDMDYDDPYQNLHIHLKKGEQVLDGEKAEQFVRFRKNNNGDGYPNGDLGRIEAQHEFIQALKKQVLTPANVLKINDFIKILTANVETNIPLAEVGKLIKLAFDFKDGKLDMAQIPGKPQEIGGISYFIAAPQNETALLFGMGKPTPTPVAANKTASTGKTSGVVTPTPVQNALPTKAPGNTQPQGATPIPTLKPSLAPTPTSSTPITLEVLNATGRTGLAAKVAEDLKKKGYQVKKVGNESSNNRVSTTIIERNALSCGKELQKALGKGKIKKEENAALGVDATIIIGDDW